jgi:hypothetical protein
MRASRRLKTSRTFGVEQFEERRLTTLVVVLNGNAFNAAGTSDLTANACQVLRRAGNSAIQVPYPTIATPAAFYGLVNHIKGLAHGQPIAIVGFSAGGSLANRIATIKAINVVSVLDYYGPPDLKDWFRYHGNDRFGNYVRSHVPFTRSAIKLFSGPIKTSAHVVAAFGVRDQNVVASQNMASFVRDLPEAATYTYYGGHGVGISTSKAALDDFLKSL